MVKMFPANNEIQPLSDYNYPFFPLELRYNIRQEPNYYRKTDENHS